MTLARSLKVHLRVLAVHGTTLRVVTLRPQTRTRFSTNYFHDTWHLLTGHDGAMLLGRLMWGLAFQRQLGTLVMLAGEHLAPTPFEADRADPILLVPDALTHVDVDILRALKLRLRRSPPAPTTIRWHTFGMPAALDADDARSYWRREPGDLRERMSRRAGFVCYTAPPNILRSTGLGIFAMSGCSTSSYLPLARGSNTSWSYDGEFQLIPDFEDDVGASIAARREIIVGEDRPLATDRERYAVWDRKHIVLARRRAARA